jgi:hypothetical protein
MLRRTLLALAAFAAFAAPAALAQAPAQDAVAFAAISPDGANLAMIRVAGDKKVLIIAPTVGEAKPKAVDISDRDARALYWATNTHVITSFARPNPEARDVAGSKELREHLKELIAAFSLNVTTMKSVQLLGARNNDLAVARRFDRLLAIVSPTEAIMAAPALDEEVAFFGIREGERTITANEKIRIRPALSLWRVNLDTGVGTPIARGEPETFMWAVKADGTPLARADGYRGEPLTLWSYASGGPKRIFEAPADARPAPQGRVGAASLLVVFGERDAQNSAKVLDLTTGVFGPELVPVGARVIGTGFDGAGASTAIFVRPGGAVWLEPQRAALQQTLNGLSPGARVEIRDVADDAKKAILKVIRDGAANWFVFDVATSKAELLGPALPRKGEQ